MWQVPPLDLLRLVYEERIIKIYLRPVDTGLPHGTSCALQSIFQANVVVGESTITAVRFSKVRDDHLSPFGDLSKDEE
jgi:hypothetical protein